MSFANPKTIKYAVRNLKPEVQEQIIQAFEIANVMDIYDGNLVQYLAVIKQMLRDRTRELVLLRAEVKKHVKELAELEKNLWKLA